MFSCRRARLGREQRWFAWALPARHLKWPVSTARDSRARRSEMRKLIALILPIIAMLVMASSASAVTTRETIPFETTITDCGNTIQLSGEVLAIFTVTETPSGGFLLAAHFQPQRITGTDELGRLYIGTGLTRDLTVLTPPGGETSTFVNRFHIVGTMGAPTLAVSETFHITVTPSGEVVAFIDQFSAECV
jgi:hypothetical protein